MGKNDPDDREDAEDLGETIAEGEMAEAAAVGEPGGYAYWEGVGEEWVERRDDRLWRCCSDAVHLEWLDRVASEMRPGRVLKTDLFDEAFGPGLLEWFGGRGVQVTGCDLAHSTARSARLHRQGGQAVIADVRVLPFRAGTFDCVLSNSTLDHFVEKGEVVRSLAEVALVLKPGGRLLLTMDNPMHPLVGLRNLWPGPWRRVGMVPYDVGVTFRAGVMERLLREAGLEVEHSTTILHAPRVLLVPLCGWLSRWRGWRKPPGSWLRMLRAFEKLSLLPTRQLTGHFVAIVARRVR